MNKFNIPVYKDISYSDHNCIVLEFTMYSKFAERWINNNKSGIYFRKVTK
jgi:hypothetical protein